MAVPKTAALPLGDAPTRSAERCLDAVSGAGNRGRGRLWLSRVQREALGHERAEFRAKAVSMAVNLALNFGLIPYFGIVGAAAATATSMVAYSVMLELLMRRHVGTSSFIATLGSRAEVPGR